MNFYLVMEGDGYGQPIQFNDRGKAAAFCHQNGIPHFFEVSPSNPMQPKKVWHLEPAGWDRKSYRLAPKAWKKTVQEHDGTHH